MRLLDNFLTSGHSFLENENLQKFRFGLLNSLLVISVFFTFLNYFASLIGFVTFSTIYEWFLLLYACVGLISFILLRINKGYYLATVNLSIFSALGLFYFALVSDIQDEFRLIWFFLSLFASFVLMGKLYGVIIMICTLLAVFISDQVQDIGYTRLALFTFFNSFLIFTGFSYFFFNKIEKDAKEFTLLNDKLKEKVSQETQQRITQEKMLLQQCRMASMGEMIDSIAHQWRQPLMSINAILMTMDRAIETNTKPPQYLEEKMEDIITLTTHMSQTVEDFRSLFKTDKEKTTFDLGETLMQVLDLFKSALKEVRVDFDDSLSLHYYGHHNELKQVIIILISNALEAFEGRHIKDRKLIFMIKEDHGRFSIIIEDNAGGIPKENIEHIFDPYFTTKQAIGGSGLGLYIAKIIIEQNMQGKLTVVNTAQGARFSIILPCG